MYPNEENLNEAYEQGYSDCLYEVNRSKRNLPVNVDCILNKIRSIVDLNEPKTLSKDELSILFNFLKQEGY